MVEALRRNSFLFGLALAVVVGFTCHSWLAPLASAMWLKTVIVVGVMSMMAAPVPMELFVRTVAKPWPGLLATLICMVGLPLLGWLVSPLLRPEFAGGLIVACCVPSTLASSAVITRKAGGDDTVAIFVTLLTNLSCVFVTPMWLVFFMGTEAKFGFADLAQELALLVVLPIVLVQVLRWRSQRFSNWANSRKPLLSIYCQVGILLMVAIGSVQMGSRWFDADSPNSAPWHQLLLIILIGLLIHLVALTLGWWLARRTGIGRPQAIGVSFSGSQKTLMIGLNLAMDYGVSILPMISYHVSQLLADAFIADYWARQGQEPVVSNSKIEFETQSNGGQDTT